MKFIFRTVAVTKSGDDAVRTKL